MPPIARLWNSSVQPSCTRHVTRWRNKLTITSCVLTLHRIFSNDSYSTHVSSSYKSVELEYCQRLRTTTVQRMCLLLLEGKAKKTLGFASCAWFSTFEQHIIHCCPKQKWAATNHNGQQTYPRSRLRWVLSTRIDTHDKGLRMNAQFLGKSFTRWATLACRS